MFSNSHTDKKIIDAIIQPKASAKLFFCSIIIIKG